MSETGVVNSGLPYRVLIAIVAGLLIFLADNALAQNNDRFVPEERPTAGNVPGGHLGTLSDAELWRAVRGGLQGQVSIPDQQAGVMIQSEGDNWRAWRNGPLTRSGIWILAVMAGLLALFFLLRGRIRIESGWSGKTIVRFNGVERFAHWLSASCFIVLALTGLNMLYGRHLLLPLLGPEAFAQLTMAGKYAHNYLSFGFMIGLVLVFLLWVRDNLPDKYDVRWIVVGGGLFTKGLHPPSRKFNFGQKMTFWVVVLGGLSLSLSGVTLLFPFRLAMFEPTSQFLNMIGINTPTGFTMMQEMQLSQLWHAFTGLIMIGVILAHIYIGSLGMEGAFSAMGRGQVDENWAREHHSAWVAEVKGEPIPDPDAPGPEHTQAAE
jgi:formate dehydrogenase subunit gamma